MICWLWHLWARLGEIVGEYRDDRTLAEQYRQLWARPVLIDGEERVPQARIVWARRVE
jgi:hypothetical protein